MSEVQNHDEYNEVKDLSTPHKYRTEHPNILYELGLDPYEFILYSFYKKIAGDRGGCIISNKKLANMCKMSLRTLISRKASLVKKNLIKVTERKNSDGTDTTSLVEIIDIWNENYSVLSARYSKKDSGVHVMHGGVSTDAHHKEEPFKNFEEEGCSKKDLGGIAQDARGIAGGATKEEPIKNLEEERALTEREKEYFKSLCEDKDYDFITDQDKFDVISDYGGEIVYQTFNNFFKKHTSLQKGKVPSSINSPIAVFRKECEKTKRWRDQNAKQ